jgi:hypothetical protein
MVVGKQVGNACLGSVFVNGGKGETPNLVKFFINFCNIHNYFFPVDFFNSQPLKICGTLWIRIADPTEYNKSSGFGKSKGVREGK